MKIEVSYAKSEAPNFDALEDIKDYLGGRYEKIAEQVKAIKEFETFEIICGFLGIEGFPVKAWFRHFHGGDAV